MGVLVVEVGRVNLASEVRAAIVSDPPRRDATEFSVINQTLLFKLIQPLSGASVREIHQISDITSSEDWVILILEKLKDLFIVHRFLPSGHYDQFAAESIYVQVIFYPLDGTGSSYGNSSLQSTKWFGCYGVPNGRWACSGGEESLRAGADTPDPVVDQTTMQTNDPRADKRPQNTADETPHTHFDARDVLAGRYDDATVSQLRGTADV